MWMWCYQGIWRRSMRSHWTMHLQRFLHRPEMWHVRRILFLGRIRRMPKYVNSWFSSQVIFLEVVFLSRLCLQQGWNRCLLGTHWYLSLQWATYWRHLQRLCYQLLQRSSFQYLYKYVYHFVYLVTWNNFFVLLFKFVLLAGFTSKNLVTLYMEKSYHLLKLKPNVNL